ncbi:NAD-dependent histone deacetylase HST3 [Madurella mycetomatis]|uniref:NAD-dependent histone deacetylase HST3 n=1 Tax=Madurella mycetomatis TaxID=100816 RepID=A0A175W133_9PEZI|nr:NAD-dependent histone deacetylase HST3 [Madurella mycetomatis]
MSEATTESTTKREASNVFSSMDLSAVCDAPTVLPYVAGTSVAEKRKLWQGRNLRAPAVPRYPKPERQQGNAQPQSERFDRISCFTMNRTHVLLIMGTSLATHGVKHLVKDFAKIIHKRAGKVVFVNLTEPAKTWDGVIDYWVEWDCDAWDQGAFVNRDIWTLINPQRNRRAMDDSRAEEHASAWTRTPKPR